MPGNTDNPNATTHVWQVAEKDKAVLAPDNALLESMQRIYRAYDVAKSALVQATFGCDAAMSKFRTKNDARDLPTAVNALEQAVVTARETNVELEAIRNAQKSLTMARAQLRILKEKKAKGGAGAADAS